ncbi:ATP-binding cassette domain-containing protein [Succinatimonas hippei]|uniref:ATP-binding cassette domain-containing protein n=1 Tax=Succinatimonas hippei TaxID=626938 RepID=UPI0026ED8CDB|nr:ATP-binding cassette domain-containing protein [Succinatimonas hippei]
MTPLLQINNLTIADKDKVFVKNAKLSLGQGECLVLTGPSGSGKTTLLKAICHLLPQSFTVSGEICFLGNDISKLTLGQLNQYFGTGISMILQNPADNFDDRKSILSHFEEAMHASSKEAKAEVKRLAVDLLYKMQLAYPQNLLKRRSFELSQGMCQRVILALTLMQQPKLILADEFTCSLDIITRVQILQLLKNLHQEMGFALFFITHNEDEARFLAERSFHLENAILKEKIF